MVGKLKLRTRRVLEKTAIGRRALEAYGLYCAAKFATRHADAKSLYSHIYETNFWGDPESVSGPDSTTVYTQNLRRQLAQLLRRLGVRRIVDAPCGDFNWFRLVDLAPGVVYVGGDIVESMMARNAALYGNGTRSFHVMDIRHDPLPASDLWICRNSLFHLSYADIYAALLNGLNSNIQYFLITTHSQRRGNTDIPTGSYRPLNFERPPFHFPTPLMRIDDWAEGEDVRQMCLWRQEQVATVVSAAPARFHP
jgi:hypothetical protein